MTQREQLSGFFLSLLLARLQNLRFVALPGWAFFSEPRPKGENLLFSSEGTLDTLFPLEYWVVSWRTDAKGTDLRSRVASSSDRRDVGLPSRSVETPFRWLHGCQSSRSTPDSGAFGACRCTTRLPLGLGLLGLVGSRLVCCLGLFGGVWRLVVTRLAFVGSGGLRPSTFSSWAVSGGLWVSVCAPSTAGWPKRHRTIGQALRADWGNPPYRSEQRFDFRGSLCRTVGQLFAPRWRT